MLSTGDFKRILEYLSVAARKVTARAVSILTVAARQVTALAVSILKVAARQVMAQAVSILPFRTLLTPLSQYVSYYFGRVLYPVAYRPTLRKKRGTY